MSTDETKCRNHKKTPSSTASPMFLPSSLNWYNGPQIKVPFLFDMECMIIAVYPRPWTQTHFKVDVVTQSYYVLMRDLLLRGADVWQNSLTFYFKPQLYEQVTVATHNSPFQPLLLQKLPDTFVRRIWPLNSGCKV